jgi:hypothetical protein
MIPHGLPQPHENKDVADEIFENTALSYPSSPLADAAL